MEVGDRLKLFGFKPNKFWTGIYDTRYDRTSGELKVELIGLKKVTDEY